MQTTSPESDAQAQPFTPAQVMNNLLNFIQELSRYEPNLEGGPGYVRLQCQNILARGIVGDGEHPYQPSLS